MASKLLAALNDMTNSISLEKQAMQKTAGPTPADPGGYAGPSSHPTTKIDNNAQKAKEGERSAENTKDVKKAEGASSVENATAPSPTETQQDGVQYNIGTKQSLTGEDPSVEDDYKGSKDDPGTSHPASADDGVKFGSFKEAADHATQLAHEILADIVTSTAAQNAQAAVKTAAVPTAQPAQPAPAEALNAGYALAAELGLQKEAAEAHVEDTLAQIFRDAVLNGELVGNYLKAAAVETEESAASAGDTDDNHKSEESDDDGGSAAAGAGPEPIVDAASAAGGGDPAASLGGSPDAALQELVAALQELGITPEMLMEAAGGGGAPGAAAASDPLGMPPAGGADPLAAAGGGLPPELGKAAAASRLQKIASASRAFQLSGKYEIKAANSSAARAARDQYKAHIRELLGVLA